MQSKAPTVEKDKNQVLKGRKHWNESVVDLINLEVINPSICLTLSKKIQVFIYLFIYYIFVIN
jgi:hypothetical protein